MINRAYAHESAVFLYIVTLQITQPHKHSWSVMSKLCYLGIRESLISGQG